MCLGIWNVKFFKTKDLEKLERLISASQVPSFYGSTSSGVSISRTNSIAKRFIATGTKYKVLSCTITTVKHCYTELNS